MIILPLLNLHKTKFKLRDIERRRILILFIQPLSRLLLIPDCCWIVGLLGHFEGQLRNNCWGQIEQTALEQITSI